MVQGVREAFPLSYHTEADFTQCSTMMALSMHAALIVTARALLKPPCKPFPKTQSTTRWAALVLSTAA